MNITDTHTVTPDEASYGVTKALLPFLIEAGTPVETAGCSQYHRLSAGHQRKRRQSITKKAGLFWQTR